MTAEMLNANDAFYRAFESLDVARMRAVRLAGDDIVCIHPGWRARIGIEAVLESWASIFRGGTPYTFTFAGARVARFGDAAMVTGLEMITAGLNLGSVQAVNAFRLVHGEWKMILHCASPIQAPA